MAPISNEEQFKFLFSCIRYSNNGKVDFTQVAKECNIVTKGAAAKRYERSMRSHGIAPSAASMKPAPSSSSSSSFSASASASRNKSSSSKKRKVSPEEDNINDDDEEETSNQRMNRSRVKREVKSEMGGSVNANYGIVKEELEVYREDSPSVQLKEGLQMGLGAGLCDFNRELLGYYSASSSAGGSVDGDVREGEFGEGDEYAGAMSTSGMNAGGMNTYGLSRNDFGFDVGGYVGYGGIMGTQAMRGNGNRMGGHGGQSMMKSMPRSHVADADGRGIGAQQYQSMGQDYDSQGGSDCPLLVE